MKYVFSETLVAGDSVSLSGKVAIVTGGSGALGSALVKVLLEHGASVVATYRNAKTHVEFDFGENVARLTFLPVDVTDESSVKAFINEVARRFGHIDILVNTVGAHVGGSEVADLRLDDWNFMLDVNLKSAFLCCKTVLPYLIRQNSGRIVNVAARPAVEKRFRVKNCAYSVSKAGVVVLTETIAEEVKKYDINANCVLPSTMDTSANRRDMPNVDFSKWVKPEDVANVILFLVENNSEVTSGATIPVYGKA